MDTSSIDVAQRSGWFIQGAHFGIRPHGSVPPNETWGAAAPTSDFDLPVDTVAHDALDVAARKQHDRANILAGCADWRVQPKLPVPVCRRTRRRASAFKQTPASPPAARRRAPNRRSPTQPRWPTESARRLREPIGITGEQRRAA